MNDCPQTESGLLRRQNPPSMGDFAYGILFPMQYSSRAETIARWSVLLLFLLTPLFFIPVPWVGIVQAKMLLGTVAITVGFLAWILMSLGESELRVPKSPLLVAALLIPIAYCISAVVTGFSWASFVGSGGGQDTVMSLAVWYFALLLSAAILGAHAGRIVMALRLLMFGTFIVLVVQALHLIIPSFTFGGALAFPATSIVGSWHDLGIFLAFATFISVALLRTPVFEGIWRYVAIITAFASLTLLVVVNYSDVWLGLSGLGVGYALLRYFSGESGSWFSRLKSVWLWLALVILGCAMYFGGNVVQGVLPSQLQIVQVEVRPSWNGTFAIGREVFAGPAQIFFGSGPNSFPQEWGRYKPLSVNGTQFWNADFNYGVGFVPTSFVTTGVLGIVAWVAVCAALLWSLWRLFRNRRSASVARMVLMISALYLTAYHIVYVPGPALSLLTFLFFGALVAEEVSAGMISRTALSLSWDVWKGRVAAVALCLFGLVLFFGGVQSTRALISDMLVNRAVVEFGASQDIAKATRSVSLALAVLPESDRAHRAGVELGILQLAQLAGSSDTSAASQAELQNTLNATIQHGLAAVEIESGNYQNWLTLARLYGELAGAGVEGAEEAARGAYAQVRENNPTNPIPYLGEAQLDLARGGDEAARKNLEAALAIKPDFAAAHFLLSQIHARANRLDAARENAAAVVQIAPQDALGWYNLGTILYAGGDYGNAALSFEQAVGIENNYANALFLLGLSYYRLDRKDDALAALKAVANANPNDTTLAEAIATIEAGEDLFAPSER